jgi:alpha-galactosidase
MNASNIYPQMLTIEAAATGDRQTLYRAALVEPSTAARLSTDEIISLCDELIEAHEKAGYPIF